MTYFKTMGSLLSPLSRFFTASPPFLGLRPWVAISDFLSDDKGMKILGVAFGSVAIVLMILATFHFWGLGQRSVAYDHPFLMHEDKSSRPLNMIPWEKSFFLEKDPDLILWADVYLNKQNDLLVRPWFERNQGLEKAGQEPNEARPRLEDLIQQFPQTRFALNVLSNETDVHRVLADVIQKTSSESRVLIQSDTHVILTSTKELLPRLVYGSSVSDIMRMRSFESLWILSAAPVKADVFVMPFKKGSVELLTMPIAKEIKRRQLKLVIGPLFDAKQIEQAHSFSPDGLFVEDPLLLVGPP